MKVIKFEPEHITLIDGQEAQNYESLIQPRTYDYGVYLRDSGPAMTGTIDGDVIFCAGCVEVWENRHLVWSVLSSKAAKHLFAITKAIKRASELYKGAGRFELIVRAGFDEGGRWAKMLGFEYNSFEKRYLPDGSDAHIYVRFL